MSAARLLATLAAAAIGVSACHRAANDSVPRLAHERRFTCCNIRHDGDEVSDANYWVGETIPAGTPVEIESVGPHQATIVAGGVKLTLKQEYGTEESFEHYLNKILVPVDPHPRIEKFPDEVRGAIARAKVERGMTREQVLYSLGYPPTHRTPSLDDREWTYWYSRFATYDVVFDARGKVARVVGRPAPTAEVEIENADPVRRAPSDRRKSRP